MPIVNGLEEAREALIAGVRDLHSPEFAACHAGVNYYHHLVTTLHAEFPAVPFEFTLCCGDDAAIAHDALRMGFTRIRLRCSDGMFAQLAAMAQAAGAVVIRNT